MTLLRSASIRTKLAISFGTAFAFVIAVGLFGLFQLHVVNGLTHEIRDVWSPRIELLGEIKRATAEHRLLALRRTQTTDFHHLAAIAGNTDTVLKALRAAERDHAARADTAEERKLFSEFAALWGSYEQAFGGVLQRLENGEITTAFEEFNTLALAAFDAAGEALDRLIAYSKQKSDQAAAKAQDAYGIAILWTIIVIFVAAACTAFAIAWVSRNVSLPILRVSEAMRRLTDGDHSAGVEKDGERGDEIGVLIDAAIGYRNALIRNARLAAERDRNREFLDRVIENVPAAIMVKDKNHRFILANRSAEKLFGLSRDRIIGKTVHEMLPRAAADLIRQHDEKLLSSEQELSFGEHQLETPANGTRWVTARRLCIHGSEGKPEYLLGVVVDVTDHRAVQQQLQQAQKMEAAGNLTGGLAHDFNNLLLIMIGNLDLLAMEITGNPSAAEMVEQILQAGLRGAELTRQMLAFSRRQPLQPRTVEIPALIDETMKMLARTLGESIEVQIRTAPDVPSVFIDAAQLEAALVNIAINARDAMPSGGKLIVETAAAEIGQGIHPEIRPGSYVCISITDSGVGMPADVLSRISEPFFTTKPKENGTGLGLSMVYGFVKQSGGNITAYSEVGRGTTFKIHIPAARTRGESAPLRRVTDEIPLAPGNEVVLAVDDNPGVRAAVVSQLKDLGYQVEIATNGETALQKIRGGMNFDLLFTDVVMPGGMNGKELATRARRIRPDLKVLFTSGFPGTSLSDGLDLEPGDALLGKPYRKRDLAKKIREMLDA
jgi:PAS domain S-box-containing protein